VASLAAVSPTVYTLLSAVSPTVYTLSVTPDANSTTPVTINVAAGKFTDTAGNANLAAVQSVQAVDTVAPTIKIEDNQPSLATGGAVIYTFTLSEPSSNFSIDDITVTGGTKAATLTTLSSTSYTLSVTPNDNSIIPITVDVAAGKFTDAVGNNNIAAVQSIQEVKTTPTLGKAIDGYLARATVTVGTYTTTTNANGDFTLPAGLKGEVVVSGGTDLTTGKAFKGVLKAPEGSSAVTPLTTVQQGFIASGQTPAEAQASVAKAFGFTNNVDLATYDPIATLTNASPVDKAQATALMANAAKIANFLVTAGETLKGAGGDKVTAASAGDAILKSLVNSVNSAGSTGVIDLGNASLLTTVLTDSAKEVAKTVTGTTDNFAAKITAMAATVASVIKDATDNIAAVVATGGSSDTLLTSMGNVSKFTQEGASAKLQDIAKTLDPANATATLASAVTSLTGDAADKSISKGSSTPEPVTPVVVPVTPPPDVTPADTTPPALSSSTPSDNATGVSLSSNIVLNFNESVRLGTTGNIVITNAVDINDTRTISVTDTTQVSVLGSTLTINPANNLKAGYDYNVKFASGVVTDLAGNAFAGISDVTTLNFTTVTNGTTASPVTTETSGNDIINGNQGSLTSGIVTFTATGNDTYIFNTVKTGSTPSDAYVQIGGFGSGDKLIFHVANTLEQAINTRYSFSDDGTDTIIYANDDDGMLFITLLGIHGLTISEPINNKTDFVALFGNSAITFI